MPSLQSDSEPRRWLKLLISTGEVLSSTLASMLLPSLSYSPLHHTAGLLSRVTPGSLFYWEWPLNKCELWVQVWDI